MEEKESYVPEEWEEALIKEELLEDSKYKEKVKNAKYYMCAMHLKEFKANNPTADRKAIRDEMSKYIKNLPNEYTMFLRSFNNLSGMVFNRLAALESLVSELLNTYRAVNKEEIKKYNEEILKNIKKGE